MKVVVKYFLIVIVVLLMLSCSRWKEESVTITKDYVINPWWDKVDNNFGVIKMKFKNEKDSIDLKTVSPSKLLQKLVEDSSFIYRAGVDYNGIDYSKRKVYFNKYNGFLWWGDLHKSSSTRETLGELKQDVWYLLTGLDKEKTLYYMYLDSKDSLHVFKVPASEWTNI